VGYIYDGFGLYGPRGDGGVYQSNSLLDECHGHTGLVPGSSTTGYHYHANYEFPYTVGCFRGTSTVPPGS
jgi:hypothetical protein